MFIPYGDDQVDGGHTPYFSYGLIVLNVLVFLYQVSLPPDLGAAFVYTWGSIPTDILAGENLHTLFTCMFLHGDWMHLIGNMLFLWIFADNIEAVVGSRVFVPFYLIGGLVASAAHVYFNTSSTLPTVGASGALSAVMGAYLVMFPRSRIKVIVIIFFIRIPAIFFLLFWFYQQSTAGYASLADNGVGGSVAWWAHIGGFVFGVLAGFWFRANYPIPRPPEIA
ncbi:MAG: rhomboid family intramembrane serine protease [Saprospiraceae bacterium]